MASGICGRGTGDTAAAADRIAIGASTLHVGSMEAEARTSSCSDTILEHSQNEHRDEWLTRNVRDFSPETRKWLLSAGPAHPALAPSQIPTPTPVRHPDSNSRKAIPLLPLGGQTLATMHLRELVVVLSVATPATMAF